MLLFSWSTTPKPCRRHFLLQPSRKNRRVALQPLRRVFIIFTDQFHDVLTFKNETSWNSLPTWSNIVLSATHHSVIETEYHRKFPLNKMGAPLTTVDYTRRRFSQILILSWVFARSSRLNIIQNQVMLFASLTTNVNKRNNVMYVLGIYIYFLFLSNIFSVSTHVFVLVKQYTQLWLAQIKSTISYTVSGTYERSHKHFSTTF